MYNCVPCNVFYTYFNCFNFTDKPRPPRVIGSDLYPELGKIAQARCQFDAKPAVSVFYIKEDPADNSWKRINDTSVRVIMSRLLVGYMYFFFVKF